MTKLAIRNLVLAVIPALLLACSSNDSPGGSGSGGSTGSGGATGSGGSTGSGGATGTGGSTGTGGATGSGGSTGTGGATGTGGSAPVDAGTGGATPGGDGGLNPEAPAMCAKPTNTDPLISNFMTAAATSSSNQANGGTDVWSVTPSGTGASAAGEMHAVTTMGNWASAGTLIGKGTCVDVSQYMGIRFKIRSATNSALFFSIQTPETSADASNYRKQITVTPTMTPVEVKFSELVRPMFAGAPVLPADYKPATRMTGLVFGVGIMTEKIDIYLDDVTFF